MKQRIHKRSVTTKCRRREKGSALPIVMLLSVLLLGMAALAIDIMYAYVASSQAQTAANAAALAGASKLTVNDIQGAKDLAVEYAAKNVIIGDSVTIDPDTDIQLGSYDPSTETFTITESNPDTIRVFVRRTQATGNPLKMFFANVLGFGAIDISNSAAATVPNKYVMLTLDRSGSMGYDIAEHSGNNLYWRAADKWYSKSSGSYLLPEGNYYSPELGQFTIQPGNPYGTCVSEKQGSFQVEYAGSGKYSLPVSTAGPKIGRPTLPSPGGWTYFASSSTWYSEYLGDFFSTPSDGYKWKYTPGNVYAWSGGRYYLRGMEEPIQPFNDVQNAANTFVGRLNLIKDKTGIVSFGSSATLDLTLSQDYNTILQNIEALEPGGYTNTPEAIDLAVQELTSNRATGFSQRVMILVSDGRPRAANISQSEMRQATLDAAAAAAEEGILIYTVTVGNTAEVDVDLMIEIANMTGGAQYHTTNSEDLSGIFNDIFERIPPRLVGIVDENIGAGAGGGGDEGQSPPPPSGGSGDVDGSISPDFYDTTICYGTVDQTTGETTQWAKMYVNATSDPDYIYAALEFDKAFADNTYGANSSGYYKKNKKTGELTLKPHNFEDLVGSDRTLFQVTDGNGNLVLEFYVDYISADAQATSGYSSLGIWGGDGSMVSGDPSYVVEASTSLAWNLTRYPSMIVDSPATDASYTPNPDYPDWIYEVAYEVKIAKAAFGTAGFGSISIPYVHASPSKLGFNTLDVQIVDCPSSGGGSTSTPPADTGSQYCDSYTTSGYAIFATRSIDNATSTVLNGGYYQWYTGKMGSQGDISLAGAIQASEIHAGGNITINGASSAQLYPNDSSLGSIAYATPSSITTLDSAPDLEITSTQTLSPGSYRDILISGSFTVYMEPGKYFVRSIEIVNSGYVELRPTDGSTGAVELYITEKFRAIGAVRINYTGLQYADGDRFVIYLAKVDPDVPTVAPTHGVPLADDSDYGFAFQGSLSMHGAIYGPQTNIYIRGSYRNDSGALVGKNIFTDDSLWLTYNEPDTFNPCDEPADSSAGSTPPDEGGSGDTGGSTPPSGGSGGAPPSSGGGSGDVDGSISPDFYDTTICYGTVDQTTGETTQWAKMYVNATSDPDYIYAALEFDKAFADNTYGANSSGYYKQDKKTGQLTPKAHNFKDLVGSDRTLFQVTDGNGNLVLEFYVDYISADTQATSGYSSLGIWGGDGSMVSGDPSYIVEANTSLSWNLVHYPTMIVDSPATDASYTPNPNYPDWIYEVVYEVKIAKAAFGTAGFGSISIPYVHASPSKLGFNTLDVQIVDCPPSDGGSSSSAPPSSGGGSGDVDGSISPDFYDTTICYGTVDQATGQATKWATMYVNATSDPDYIYAALEFDKAFADNTYGANSSGYYKQDKKTGQLTPKAHNFKDLVGSDRTLFQVTDANGNLVLEFYVDYISADTQATSGYSSLGIWGGDGSMVSGDPSYIVEANTSLSWNLVHYPTMIVDSPATDASYTPNPDYPDWIYEVVYEVKIAKAAFGTAGFGSISIPYVHASPSKLGFNTLNVQIVDCVSSPPSGSPSGGSSNGGSSSATAEFTKDKLTVHVGDTFKLSDYVEKSPDTLAIGADITFYYKEGTTPAADWHLDDFNNDNAVKVVKKDRKGHSIGQKKGKYRVYMAITGQDGPADYITIRVKK